jgi:hypothetical protein
VLYNNQRNFVDLLRISGETDGVDVKTLFSSSSRQSYQP